MNFHAFRKGVRLCVAMLTITVLLSGCLLGWLGVPSPADALERRRAQKSTSSARSHGVMQAEIHINGQPLLLRLIEKTAGEEFWGFTGSHGNRKVTEDLLANEGVLIDYTLALGGGRNPEQEREKIGIPCLSTEDVMTGLSLAYLNEQGVILSIMDMLPDVRVPLYCAPQHSIQALAMPYGWFEANNVRRGDVASGFKRYISNARRNEIIAQWSTPSARQQELAEIEKSYVPALRNGTDRIMETKVVGPWIGQTQEKQAHLVIIVPAEAANQQASIERFQALKPWEAVLYYLNEHRYYTADGTYTLPRRPGSGTMSVATLDKNGTVTRIFDVSENEDIVLHKNDAERYALIASSGWLEAYASPGKSKILPFNPLSRSQLPQVVIKAQAQQAQTERLLALVRQKRAQEAEFRAWAQDFNQLTNHYTIQVTHHYGSPKIGGNHDKLPGFWDRLLGADGSNLDSRAWQCSDRNYTVTLHPKRDIGYVDAARNPNPVAIDATWNLSQVIGGDTTVVGSTQRQLKLPLRTTQRISESFSFDCVDDLHTDRGQETASDLRMALAGQSSSFRVHHATTPAHRINRNAVYAENSRQWGLLSAAIDAHNAAVDARRGRQGGGTGRHPGYTTVHVDMNCGFSGCRHNGSSGSVVSGSMNVSVSSRAITFQGLPTATGRVQITSTFDNKTCSIAVDIVDGNDYDLNFNSNCNHDYTSFTAR